MAWVMETRARINISRELPQQERVEIINNIMVNKIYIYIYKKKLKIYKKIIYIVDQSWRSRNGSKGCIRKLY